MIIDDLLTHEKYVWQTGFIRLHFVATQTREKRMLIMEDGRLEQQQSFKNIPPFLATSPSIQLQKYATLECLSPVQFVQSTNKLTVKDLNFKSAPPQTKTK